MPAIALKFAFALCSILLWRLLYFAFRSAVQYRAAREHKKLAEVSRRVNWPVSENGGRVVRLAIGSQFRRRPSSPRMSYPFTERRRA
jgi:hypothetical protein